MLGTYLYIAQRLSALVLAPLVLVHLALIVYAAHDGWSAADILGRTRGSFAWGAYYSLFVVAAALHATIGLRAIAAEVLRWRGWRLELAAACLGLALIILGARAVAAVVL